MVRGERSHCWCNMGLSSPQICSSQVGQAAVPDPTRHQCRGTAVTSVPGHKHEDKVPYWGLRTQKDQSQPGAATAGGDGWCWHRSHELTCPAAAPVCPSGEPSGAGCRPPSAAGVSGTAPASVALSHGCHCRGCTWTSACRDTDVTHCQCQGQHRLDPGVLRPALGVQPRNTSQRSPESRRGRVGA